METAGKEWSAWDRSNIWMLFRGDVMAIIFFSTIF